MKVRKPWVASSSLCESVPAVHPFPMKQLPQHAVFNESGFLSLTPRWDVRRDLPCCFSEPQRVPPDRRLAEVSHPSRTVGAARPSASIWCQMPSLSQRQVQPGATRCFRFPTLAVVGRARKTLGGAASVLRWEVSLMRSSCLRFVVIYTTPLSCKCAT